MKRAAHCLDIIFKRYLYQLRDEIQPYFSIFSCIYLAALFIYLFIIITIHITFTYTYTKSIFLTLTLTFENHIIIKFNLIHIRHYLFVFFLEIH